MRGVSLNRRLSRWAHGWRDGLETGPGRGMGEGPWTARFGVRRGPPRRHDHHSRSLTRRRAIDWLCSWQTRDSVTFSTVAISFRFMSCS